jgi:hypothetical protein
MRAIAEPPDLLENGRLVFLRNIGFEHDDHGFDLRNKKTAGAGTCGSVSVVPSRTATNAG